jgi:hypothetical protein
VESDGKSDRDRTWGDYTLSIHSTGRASTSAALRPADRDWTQASISKQMTPVPCRQDDKTNSNRHSQIPSAYAQFGETQASLIGSCSSVPPRPVVVVQLISKAKSMVPRFWSRCYLLHQTEVEGRSSTEVVARGPAADSSNL